MKRDERDKMPLKGQMKDTLEREGRKQGIHPTQDTFADQMDDRGQDIEDELAREETVSNIDKI